MPMLVQICIVVVTIALAAVAVALVRTFGQLQSTANQVERTMERLERTLPEVERAVAEANGVLGSLGNVANRVDRLSEDFYETGNRLARASSLVVDEVVHPATNIATLARAVRTGAGALVSSYLKRRQAHAASAQEGENHHE